MDKNNFFRAIINYGLNFLIITTPIVSSAAMVTQAVGRVGDYFLTSREVIASRHLEKILFPDEKLTVIEKVSAVEFSMQVTSSLLEKVVASEAESFSVANVPEVELKEFLVKAKKETTGNPSWQALEISQNELQELLARKLRSKKFLKYKSDAANLTVTDYEVKEYYDKSKYKFGDLPFDSFKENIRQYLIKKQTEDRLREWFEVLRKKYQVRNFLAESA